MPTLRYALEANGPKRLELSWEGQYQNFTVTLDKQVVGQVAGAKALAAGHSLELPDGSTLLLKTAGTALANELRVLRNGSPVPGSASDPALRLRNTYLVIYFIAGVNLALGLLAGLLRMEALVRLGFGWGSVILGCVYLVLGWLVAQRSLFALILTLVLYGLETVMSLLIPLLTGTGQNFVGLLARAVILFFLLQGIGTMRRLQRAQPETAATP